MSCWHPLYGGAQFQIKNFVEFCTCEKLSRRALPLPSGYSSRKHHVPLSPESPILQSNSVGAMMHPLKSMGNHFAMAEEKPHYHGHRKRLKERYLKTGLNALEDYEVLELLLTHSQPRRDVKPAAKNLLKTFGGLKEVLEADIQASSPDEVRIDKAKTLVQRLMTELGMPIAEAKTLLGVGEKESFTKLFK